MKQFRFLTAACAGTLFYVLISLVVGRDGFWATNQLQEQKRMVSKHTAEIQKTTDELTLESLALQNDKDVIAAYARKLGYVGDGEKLVKISGLAAKETQIFDPGTVVACQTVKYVPEWVCKSIGLVIFGLVYIILLLSDYNKGLLMTQRRSQRPEKRGVAAYDLSKI